MAAARFKDKLRRLVLLPLLLFYCLVLVVAAWPRILTPGNDIPTIQLAAHFLLFHLGWPVGQSVFSGQATASFATRMNCHRIEAVDGKGSHHIVYDSLWRCERDQRSFLKDPIERFHEKHLTFAFHLLQTKPARLDRNRYPLKVLFALSDYYCLQKPGATKLIYTRIQKNIDYASGKKTTDSAIEGAHHCALGAWQSY